MSRAMEEKVQNRSSSDCFSVLCVPTGNATNVQRVGNEPVLRQHALSSACQYAEWIAGCAVTATDSDSSEERDTGSLLMATPLFAGFLSISQKRD